MGGCRVGNIPDVLGRNFVLKGPNPFLKSDQIVMRLTSHGKTT